MTAASRGYDLHLIVDRNSVEIFAQGGSIAMTDLIFPPSASIRIVPFAQGDAATGDVQGQVWRLASIWGGAATTSSKP